MPPSVATLHSVIVHRIPPAENHTHRRANSSPDLCQTLQLSTRLFRFCTTHDNWLINCHQCCHFPFAVQWSLLLLKTDCICFLCSFVGVVLCGQQITLVLFASLLARSQLKSTSIIIVALLSSVTTVCLDLFKCPSGIFCKLWKQPASKYLPYILDLHCSNNY